MVGRLDRNLRSGHRSEHAAVEMLRAYCAVAPVAQLDDFGFDALCTLVTRDGRFLVPGRSFLLQTKAHSVRHFTYTANGLEWLARLELPLFIARVSKNRNRLDLFTTERMLSSPFGRDRAARIEFAPPSTQALIHGPDATTPTEVAYMIGPPCLTIERADDPDPDQLALLARWVEFTQESVTARAEGRFPSPPRYTTNTPPESSGVATFGSDPDQVRRVAERLNPLLWQLRGFLLAPPDTSPVTEPIDRMHDLIRQLGVPPMGWFGGERYPARVTEAVTVLGEVDEANEASRR